MLMKLFDWKPAFLQDSCQSFYGPGQLTLCQCYLKMHVGVRGLAPISEFWDISFLQLAACWWVYSFLLKTSRRALFLPLLMSLSELSPSLLYFNKTFLHKSSEQSSLVTGPGLNFSPLEAKNPSVFHGSAATFHNSLWYQQPREVHSGIRDHGPSHASTHHRGSMGHSVRSY